MEGQNYIVSCYLTSGIDTQRGVQTAKDKREYMQKWYDSVVRLGHTPVVLNDGLTNMFKRAFDRALFIDCDPLPSGMQIYDYRWILYYEFLLNNYCDAVFFTDISDVVAVRDCFYEMERDVLYCGDEKETLKKCEWIQKSLRNDYLTRFEGFSDIIQSDMQVLNCGIFGGTRDIVGQFLYIMVSFIEKVRFREIDGTVDMALFNYIAYYYFNFVHGEPVNSVFKDFQDRNDVWFIHK